MLHGRRYFNDMRYMFPADLKEIQRQNLRLMLEATVLGGPLNCPIDYAHPPTKILDIGCSNGYWVSVCHDFFCYLGLPAPSFTGIDLARDAPNLRRFGIDWTYVQHDLQYPPLPFKDEEFDIIVASDMASTMSMEDWWAKVMIEILRILKPGGILELRGMDHTVRRISQPNEPIAVEYDENASIAKALGGFLIRPDSEFKECQNKWLENFNTWVSEVLVKRDTFANPVRALSEWDRFPGYQEREIKRVAIPLSPCLTWEKISGDLPNEEQQAVRSTALEVLIGLVEALEPILSTLSGKNAEEWKSWWNAMVVDLVHDNGCAGGECIEVGTWWARKVGGNSECARIEFLDVASSEEYKDKLSSKPWRDGMSNNA